MKLNRNDIEALVAQKYILMNKHPNLDLYILNYSKQAQFEKMWNEYTLMARGLVVDGDFNIVARPFPKFFNIEEHESEEIPYDLPFDVFEKMDGSLGILFNYDDYWYIATRGSFVSDQAIRGSEILNKMTSVHLNENYTYLLEIIYPENRIVVNYHNKEDLVVLGAYDNKTGLEIPYDDLKNVGLTRVKKYDGINTIDEIRSLLEDDTHEGVIVRFSNGFRMKVKWKEYCRLHRIVTNVSNKTIWEFLKEGKSFDELIERVPDEFFNWIEKTKNDLNLEYMKIEFEALKVFYDLYYKKRLTEKKDFALKAVMHRYSSIIFKLYNGKEYSDNIWKLVQPNFAKPFTEGDEE